MSRCTWAILGLAAITLASCASADWETRYRDKERQATELSADLDATRGDQAKLQASNQVLTDQLRRERSEKDRLRSELDGLRSETSQVSAPAPEPAVDIAALKRKMDFGDIRLDDSGNVVITLESGITFSSGSAKLSAAGCGILTRVAATLRSDFPDRQIRLIGHTDTDPIRKSGFQDNWSLAFERARAVGVFFRDEGKLAEENLVLMSRGQHEPLASNKDDSGKRKNRRVEVVVVLPAKADLSAYR